MVFKEPRGVIWNFAVRTSLFFFMISYIFFLYDLFINVYIYIYKQGTRPGHIVANTSPPWGLHPLGPATFPGRPPFCCPDTWAKGCDMNFSRSSKF